MLFGRHDRIYLDPDMSRSAVSASSEEALEHSLRWAQLGNAFVACRTSKPLPDNLVAIAVRFPRQVKPGLALAANSSAIARRLPPMLLSEAIEAAPAAHRPFLHDLEKEAARNAIALHICGSLFWQASTGASYMTDMSDIDILFRPETEAALDSTLQFLSEAVQFSPVRLDGEAIFPGQLGVSWRELAAARDQVLVKAMNFVSLMAARDLRCLLRRKA
jgi:malonate decarboxylase holo-[acyl-carrier-protein] synthase